MPLVLDWKRISPNGAVTKYYFKNDPNAKPPVYKEPDPQLVAQVREALNAASRAAKFGNAAEANLL